ncbi:MAG: hypothetical protein AN487_23165, partial [Anabaena sp. CRKS33]
VGREGIHDVDTIRDNIDKDIVAGHTIIIVANGKCVRGSRGRFHRGCVGIASRDVCIGCPGDQCRIGNTGAIEDHLIAAHDGLVRTSIDGGQRIGSDHHLLSAHTTIQGGGHGVGGVCIDGRDRIGNVRIGQSGCRRPCIVRWRSIGRSNQLSGCTDANRCVIAGRYGFIVVVNCSFNQKKKKKKKK